MGKLTFLQKEIQQRFSISYKSNMRTENSCVQKQPDNTLPGCFPSDYSVSVFGLVPL